MDGRVTSFKVFHCFTTFYPYDSTPCTKEEKDLVLTNFEFRIFPKKNLFFLRTRNSVHLTSPLPLLRALTHSLSLSHYIYRFSVSHNLQLLCNMTENTLDHDNTIRIVRVHVCMCVCMCESFSLPLVPFCPAIKSLKHL